ncbi:hypothetical protein G6F22_011758 [Rhizopus arrhizus]|nr:hypothetical protein G6F22_011758 [Rhizopus arrhizus]KAG1167959.1 hypothetical protein G6F35_017571 [Rhizopus arrhizus]
MLRYASYNKRMLSYGSNLPEAVNHGHPPYPSGCTTSPTVSSISRNPPTPSKRPQSLYNASIPLPKIAKPKRDNSQPILTTITPNKFLDKILKQMF